VPDLQLGDVEGPRAPREDGKVASVSATDDAEVRIELTQLGWDDDWAALAAETAAGRALAPARITIEHRGAYEAIAASGPVWAELRGRDYFEAKDKRELPTVGDWILVAAAESGVSPIEALLPRRSCLVRAAAGEKTLPQPIAANVDVAFVVTSANLDLNARRVERYLATVTAGGATPVIVLNKIDLVDDPAPLLERLAEVAPGVRILSISAARGDGIDRVREVLAGKTGVVVGSSGVGKSTLLNQLHGAATQDVRPVRDDDDRGRHTTTRRELFLLEGGGVLIDTPGMRELKVWADPTATGDDELAFDDVSALAAQCRFRDCTHGKEPGCAVRAAVPAERLAAWQKLRREQLSQAEAKQRARVGSRALRQRLRDKGAKE
jgi:ribosome biogenesis GTPase / thiamine phosphate phosphatase